MFSKILIANRGEIACRVIETARRMGIKTVAVYSDADRHAMHVTLADEAVYIGEAPAKDSYLQGQKVIDAALKTNAQAIHPGYGFLSENAEFCRLCQTNNLTFIGPPVPAIEAMGSKSAAKAIMEKANVPLVPGYHGEDQSEALIKQHADAMGYPVLLKAAAGGGGKGMRQVWSEEEFSSALAAAKRESMAAFNDDVMLVEKYLTQPRHVEIQVFCDNFDNAVYLFERDCSVQRRHQKVIEEAPAPGLSEEVREQMGQAAIAAAKAIGYRGAGTVEFLYENDGSFYFMEMNTRLQVEHPVTEMITGQDLVEWQFRVASGETLPLQQDDLKINGHAFEARIYAEDPDQDFLPATGTLNFLKTPTENAHVRVDTGVRQGDDVSVYYDPMIAKLIVWDEDRSKALARLRGALKHYQIQGVTTNIDFLYNVASNDAFANADIDTSFIEKHQQSLFNEQSGDIESYLPLAATYVLLSQKRDNQALTSANDPYSPWHNNNAWRANEKNLHKFELNAMSERYDIEVEECREGEQQYYLVKCQGQTYDVQGQLLDDGLLVTVNGHRQQVVIAAQQHSFSIFTDLGAITFAKVVEDFNASDDNAGDAGLQAPMNGTLIATLVEVGDEVSKGQALMIMEAMKMEHTIVAPANGKVSEFYYQSGDMIDGGSALLAFDAE
ncbi:acetyl/propionyl/methylcrotonyl-CoA carboxylase subunit alpha [Thalassotalea sp. PS06]|uniref:acetyl-CoA carboxylase biotin carboxylase subunit n=1 Tax=Thalassotalea sp. PS06 TaxID=2594005 RepID=UPI00116225D2|nr:acetyl/propionyl/methylcrotonyl-CoA carboxylase subunit alpha [Thalassotalea sp. PS06]QDP00806.1 acetyl/propionyl/methylcrotonyl-CoA carboxylase subunit alpha [Thalassotalea sp. PS06]